MIVALVQGHPGRSHRHQALLDALGVPGKVLLHASDPPDPWSGYKQCLQEPVEGTHTLIIQDDAIPCPNFGQALPLIAARHPDVPVCLFLGGAPADTAARARRALIAGRERYVPLGPSAFMPLVAVLWPKRKAEEFLWWAERTRTTRADDANAYKWKRRTKQTVLCTVPSLVQHDEAEPSVKGGDVNTGSWRRAALLASDALDYDW